MRTAREIFKMLAYLVLLLVGLKILSFGLITYLTWPAIQSRPGQALEAFAASSIGLLVIGLCALPFMIAFGWLLEKLEDHTRQKFSPRLATAIGILVPAALTVGLWFLLPTGP